MTFQDVIPITLGTDIVSSVPEEAEQDIMVVSPIINRNTIIPVQKSKSFMTYEDNQTHFDVEVLQGDGYAHNCHRIGCIKITGVPPGPA